MQDNLIKSSITGLLLNGIRPLRMWPAQLNIIFAPFYRLNDNLYVKRAHPLEVLRGGLVQCSM